MAKSAAKSSARSAPPEGLLGLRFLIVLFALGLVIIGVYPISAKVRQSITNVTRYVRKSLPEINLQGLDERSDPANRRSMLWDSAAEEAPPKKTPENVTVDRAAKVRPQLDRLSPNDRKQLSDLVNSF